MPTSYTASNKLIYTWVRGARPVPHELLTSYAESLIIDGDKRILWYKGHQIGNSYYGSLWGENYNDFLNNTAIGAYSHAEGSYTNAEGAYSHAAGFCTSAEGDASHAEGMLTYADGDYSHAEGYDTVASGDGSHAEGYSTSAEGAYSHVEGFSVNALGDYSHSEGSYTIAEGIGSHTEGSYSNTVGEYSHAEGSYTQAAGDYSHAEGCLSYSLGSYSHAEGDKNFAVGEASHSEGELNITYGDYSHAEGHNTITYGEASHSEGAYTVAAGDYSHTEGYLSYAIGERSMTIGTGTQAYNDSEFAIGQWNESGTGYIFSIGDGTSYEDRHNIMTVTKEATYINNLTYITTEAFGDISNTYVQFTGEDKPMNLLIQALLDEPEYTQPVIYTRFAYQIEGYPVTYLADEVFYPSYIDEGDVVTIMEAGTVMHAGLQVYWPTCFLGGTRMDTLEPEYETIAPEKLGYSYGLVEDSTINFSYNTGDYLSIINYSSYEANVNGEIPASNLNSDFICLTYTAFPTIGYAPETGDPEYYEIIKDISLSYTESSYMVYKQLKKVDKTQISYNGWFEGANISLPVNWKVQSRYRWHTGFSQNIPFTREDVMKFGNEVTSGFLDYCDKTTYTYIKHTVSPADSLEDGYFWIAVPYDYELVAWDDFTFIECVRGDGVSFDLISPQQGLGVNTVANFAIGENARILLSMDNETDYQFMTKPYAIYYVKLNFGALGNDAADEIHVKICGSGEAVLTNYLCIDETGIPIAYEDGTNQPRFNLLYDYNDVVEYFGANVVMGSVRAVLTDEQGNKYIYTDLVKSSAWQQHISNRE